jgi:hypothetical protein
VVVDALYDERTGLRTGLLSVGLVTRKIPTAGEGQWVRVDGVVVDPKYPSYTRADCPRYQGHPGRNCPGAGRSAVGDLVAGSLLGPQGRRR